MALTYPAGLQSKIKRTKSLYATEFETLKSFVPEEEHKNIKLTMCAPEWFHLRHGDYAYSKDVYKNDGESAVLLR